MRRGTVGETKLLPDQLIRSSAFGHQVCYVLRHSRRDHPGNGTLYRSPRPLLPRVSVAIAAKRVLQFPYSDLKHGSNKIGKERKRESKLRPNLRPLLRAFDPFDYHALPLRRPTKSTRSLHRERSSKQMSTGGSSIGDTGWVGRR